MECNVREVRVVVASILEKTLESALYFQDAGLDCLLDMLLSLLDKDVPENCKNCSQYFSLFSNFAQRVRKKDIQISRCYIHVVPPDHLSIYIIFSGIQVLPTTVKACCLSKDAHLPARS